MPVTESGRSKLHHCVGAVQFTYNLRLFGKKGSQNISDYESQGGRRGFGGMPGQGGRPAGGPPAGGPPMGGGRGPGGFGGGGFR